MTVPLLTCLLISVELTTGAQENTNCVLPDGGTKCNRSKCQKCQPLMWYVNQTQTLSGTELIFLKGNHTLYLSMIFTNTRDFTMIGDRTVGTDYTDKTPLPATRVVCKANGGVVFRNSRNISIERLSFVNCGVNTKFNMALGDSPILAAVTFCTCYNITMTQTLITDSVGYGLAVKNTHGHFHVTGSAFMKSKPPVTSNQTGNARFWFKSCYANCTSVSVLIENSWFLNGSGGAINNNGSGLSLSIYRPLVTVMLNNITVKDNIGGNVDIQFWTLRCSTSASKIDIHDSFIEQGTGTHGGGLLIQINKNKPTETCVSQTNVTTGNTMSITNTVLRGNLANRSGGAVRLIHYEQLGRECPTIHVNFSNCTFKNNSAQTGAAVHITKHDVHVYKPRSVPQLTVTFEMCNTTRNFLANYSEQLNEDGIFDFFGVEAITIQNCTFTKNHGAALMVTDSAIVFKNYTLFQGNIAAYGGAIKVCERSLLFLKDGSHIRFLENNAHVAGGAIYAGNQCLEVSPPCFFQPDVSTSVISQLGNKINLEFVNNAAVVAGSAIYGGAVDACFTYDMFSVNGTDEPNYYNSLEVYKAIFKFADSGSDVSRVTSDPYGICTCDPRTNEANCSSRYLHHGEMFPGEWFDIFVSAVGQTNGSVPALITVDPNENATIKPSSDTNQKTVPDMCQTLQLAVLSMKINSIVTLVLSVHQSNPVSERSIYYKLPKLKVTVPLSPCPKLFQLNKTNGCDCHHLLKEHDVKCDINSKTISSKPRKIWFNCITSSSNSSVDQVCDRIEMSKECSDHCSPNVTVINLNSSDFDNQCIHGRTGRVCGSCKDGLTLSLGKPKCLDNESYCSWWKTLLYLFVFVLSGPLFVFFLAIFNFTVSEGTVNGLLFYANFVHANRQCFFPDGASNTDLFRIFINWLNLDFGFEVCFYAGFDAYQKVWWEFAFLFYLFLLGLLIIYSSHKFIRVTRLVGRNVVSVLATIMLFSFPKLVHTSIKVLEPFTVKIFDRDYNYSIPIPVWKHNGNIDFFQGKHIPLAILAIFMCTIAFLYTLSLLFIQCLQRRSNWFILKWVNKLRPFFDANTGPCRDHYRFWPGFLLFARFGLYCVYIPDSVTKDQKLYIILGFCVFMFFLACVSPLGVYKKWPLNILEFSFFLNLGILSGLVVTLHNVPSIAFTFPSIGIAAITFGCILVFHSYKRISGTRKWKRLVVWVREKCGKQQSSSVLQEQVRDGQDSQSETEEVDERTPLSRRRMPPVANFTSLRESLLAYNDQV